MIGLWLALAWSQEPAFAASSDDGVLRAGIDAVVPRPAAELWPALSGEGAQHAWVPYMRTAKLERVEGDAALCDGLTELPWPFRDRTWVVRMTARASRVDGRATYVAAWDYVPGSGSLEDTEGAWSLEELPDGRTRVRLEAMADLGKAVPAPLLRWAEAKALPSMFDALLAQADGRAR
ncbi:MAG: hypothetical protein EP330_09890 [Deltaproteobacteria bacterium]|nr:MAG: hypothetical protein EP330_09890 [Deltaproteobacteria bacterium]